MLLIHQIATNDDFIGAEQSWSFTIKELHSDSNLYTYKLWSKSDVRSLAASNHQELYTQFDDLSSIQQANFGRFLILFVHGGFVLSGDVHINAALDSLNYDSNKVYLPQTTRLLPMQRTTLGSYAMYSPPGNLFFKALIDAGLDRVKHSSTYLPYVSSYTSGRLLINSLKDSFEVFSFLPNEVTEKNCDQKTIEGKPIVVHNRCHKESTHKWQDEYLTKIDDYECYFRKRLHIDSNFCSFPIVGTSAVVLIILLLLMLSRWRR